MDSPSAVAERAFAECERGNFGGVDAALAALTGATSPVEHAWRACLRAARWFVDAAAPPPSADELADLCGASDEARAIACEACVPLERASALSFNGGLDRWIALHERLLPAGPAPRAALALGAARLWRRVLAAESGGAGEEARALARDAAEARVAPVVVEATALAALAAAEEGELTGALETARRAARMAQAEGLPACEHLAHLVLARARRLSGRPHLALRILTALAREAHPASWDWVAWELLLAGGEALAAELAARLPEARAGRLAVATFAAAATGDRPAFDSHAAALLAALTGFRALAVEAEAVLALVDAARAPTSTEVAEWCSGKSHDTPAGLHGMGSHEDPGGSQEIAIAHVLARPGAPGRRVLAGGLGLVAGPRSLAGDGRANGAGARTDTGIASLALAGPEGLEKEEFFRTVYLFPFVRELHQGILDTLIHRMRRRLGPSAEIVRREADGAIALRLAEPLLVPDVRCAVPAADRILRALAAAGPATAEEAAEKLRMPLRTIQRAFQKLVEEGALAPRRAGRHVAYAVHDTTFTQITLPGR